MYILFFVYYVSSSFTWQLKTLNFDIIGHGQVMNIICSTQECYRVNCYMFFSWKAASCSACYGSQLLWQWREVVILFLRNISVTLVTCWSLYYLQTVPHHLENTSYLSALVLQQNKLRWYGHVLRKDDDDWVTKCMEYEVEGSRPRGRPKRTWREVIQEDCQARRLNKEDAMDRCKWRKMIKDVRTWMTEYWL